jgi:hypothetical protein
MTDKSEFPNFRWYVQGNPPEWWGHFELGFQNKKKKSATFKHGSIAVYIHALGAGGHFAKEGMRGDPQHRCDMCLTAGVQRGENIWELRGGRPDLLFAPLSARAKSYVAEQARNILCGLLELPDVVTLGLQRSASWRMPVVRWGLILRN